MKNSQKTPLLFFILLNFLSFTQLTAQVNPDTIKSDEPVIIILNDSTNAVSDSTMIREQFIKDSIAQREAFIRDSLIAREKFIKDSLYHRKLILDSVTFLKQNLPKFIEADIKSNNEEIILYTEPVRIIGDSALSDFKYIILSQKFDAPYAPWRQTVELSKNSLKINIDTINKVIKSVRSPKEHYSVIYNPNSKTVKITKRGTILKKRAGNLYKVPTNTIFFDHQGRVKKIKTTEQYFEMNEKYQKGGLLYTDIKQIKEFNYFPDGVLSFYKVVNYCGRETGKEKNEVCHTVTYTIHREGNKFTIEKKNIPENVYSDGTLIFEFDDHFDMKSMQFNNVSKDLSRKCIIELNDDRYVKRYLYEKNGKINKTILINYNNNPDAKYKVEKIVCYFEDDGISYYQKNVTTGKSRKRDKLTLKWSPWK